MTKQQFEVASKLCDDERDELHLQPIPYICRIPKVMLAYRSQHICSQTWIEDYLARFPMLPRLSYSLPLYERLLV
jgi:hypothetical protein